MPGSPSGPTAGNNRQRSLPDNIHILGMPRSGTAFVSAVLNLHPSCICFHEPAAAPGWKRKMADAGCGVQYIGTADTISGMYPQFTLPHSRCVYLRRPFDESLKSIQRIHFMAGESLQKVSEANEQWATDRNALIVENPFEAKALRAIWNHVFRETLQADQSQRLERFITLNIQRHAPKEAWGDTLYPD